MSQTEAVVPVVTNGKHLAASGFGSIRPRAALHSGCAHTQQENPQQSRSPCRLSWHDLPFRCHCGNCAAVWRVEPGVALAGSFDSRLSDHGRLSAGLHGLPDHFSRYRCLSCRLFIDVRWPQRTGASCTHFIGGPSGLADRPHLSDLCRIRRACPQLQRQPDLLDPGKHIEVQASGGITCTSALTSGHRRDRLPFSADRVSIHDGGPDRGNGHCSGQLRSHRFSRSQDSAIGAYLGRLPGASLYALECGMARPASSIPCRGRLRNCNRRLGGELLQRYPQAGAAMNFQLIGVNHKTAPVEVREQLAIPDGKLRDALQNLLAISGVHEGMILSTCNRVEVLAHTANGSTDLRDFLRALFGLSPSTYEPHLYEYREQDAVRHVFRVTSSLDSMVVGEPQILGQVKEAYATARALGAVQSYLDLLLTRAFAVAKRVRTETAVGSSHVSVASCAVDLAGKIFGSLNGKQVCLVGAGKMSEIAARHLLARGAGPIFVANRTYERAQVLAGQFGGRAIRFDALYDHCEQADIVITSTGDPVAIFR